ncbi:MAG: transglutaminase domain-containing protein [Eubacteriales bacterium]
MKTLRFHYHMDITFSQPISQHYFTLKCIPQTDNRQIISDLAVKVRPHEMVSHGTDGFGNTTIYGHQKSPHQSFYCDVAGMATMGEAPEPVLEPTYRQGRFVQQSTMTKMGESLTAYFHDFSLEGSNLEIANRFMTDLYEKKIKYTQGVTTVETTAEQALSLGKGVCQDYAHILLSLCRGAHIPARYVAGFMVGEGYSHGWVEVFQLAGEGRGYWVPLDPTNHLTVTQQHIKVAIGRDARDCALNHGVFRGNGWQTQWSSVIVYDESI